MTHRRPTAWLLVVPFLAAWAPEPPKATTEAVCRRARAAPTIDGVLDDPAWKDAAVIERFPTYWKGTDPGSKHATRARLLWDDDALYFSAEMTDAELRAFGTRHNDFLWNGDVFELFFKPGREAPSYYEFQANPNSAVFEAFMPARGKVGDLAKLPPLGMVAKVKLEGTLDKPGDADKGWTVEGKIPWTAFAPTGGKPKPGAAWTFALCRYDYGVEGTDPVLMSSAPLTKPNFHRYEDYGTLTFEGPAKP